MSLRTFLSILAISFLFPAHAQGRDISENLYNIEISYSGDVDDVLALPRGYIEAIKNGNLEAADHISALGRDDVLKINMRIEYFGLNPSALYILGIGDESENNFLAQAHFIGDSSSQNHEFFIEEGGQSPYGDGSFFIPLSGTGQIDIRVPVISKLLSEDRIKIWFHNTRSYNLDNMCTAPQTGGNVCAVHMQEIAVRENIVVLTDATYINSPGSEERIETRSFIDSFDIDVVGCPNPELDLALSANEIISLSNNPASNPECQLIKKNNRQIIANINPKNYPPYAYDENVINNRANNGIEGRINRDLIQHNGSLKIFPVFSEVEITRFFYDNQPQYLDDISLHSTTLTSGSTRVSSSSTCPLRNSCFVNQDSNFRVIRSYNSQNLPLLERIGFIEFGKRVTCGNDNIFGIPLDNPEEIWSFREVCRGDQKGTIFHNQVTLIE